MMLSRNIRSSVTAVQMGNHMDHGVWEAGGRGGRVCTFGEVAVLIGKLPAGGEEGNEEVGRWSPSQTKQSKDELRVRIWAATVPLREGKRHASTRCRDAREGRCCADLKRSLAP